MGTLHKKSALAALLACLTCLLVLTSLTNAVPASPSINFEDNFTSSNLHAWQFPYAEDWQIAADGPLYFLHMLRNREPLVPRRPMQFALLKGVNVGSFTFQAQVRRAGRSVMMVFNYVDGLHFYYTHLSVDSGVQQPVHNGIFMVDGAPRRRIAGETAAPVLPDQDWHTVRVRRDVKTGSIEVFVDKETQPRFSVVDHTFTCGQVGLGSFDETGDFTNVRLTSHDAGCKPSGASNTAG